MPCYPHPGRVDVFGLLEQAEELYIQSPGNISYSCIHRPMNQSQRLNAGQAVITLQNQELYAEFTNKFNGLVDGLLFHTRIAKA